MTDMMKLTSHEFNQENHGTATKTETPVLPPRPYALQIPGVPHVYFPPYSREESVRVLAHRNTGQSPVFGLSSLVELGFTHQQAAELHTSFLPLVHDALIGPTGSTLPVFAAVVAKLWPRFIAPILDKVRPPGFAVDDEYSPLDWDLSRLIIRSRALLRDAESLLVHRIIGDGEAKISQDPHQEDTSLSSVVTTSKRALAPTIVNTPAPASASDFPKFPYIATVLLASAFLAAHIPPRLDMVFFSRYAAHSKSRRGINRRRVKLPATPSRSGRPATGGDDPDFDLDDPTATPSGKRRKTASGAAAAVTPSRITKSTIKSGLFSSSAASSVPGVIQARPFTLERLLAIFHAVLANSSKSHSHTLSSIKSLSDTVIPELATLQRLRLLVPASASSDDAGPGEKWMLHAGVAGGNRMGRGVSGMGAYEWIIEISKSVGVDVEEYIASGLD
ncbi:hypothetical protein KEM52_003480 [Ascosphaera acerosa]|nr:hypothetical protein KEM52_003480 [Ascosphaera acerosa]